MFWAVVSWGCHPTVGLTTMSRASLYLQVLVALPANQRPWRAQARRACRARARPCALTRARRPGGPDLCIYLSIDLTIDSFNYLSIGPT